MEDQISYFGVDISKKTLDICRLEDCVVDSFVIENNNRAIKKFLKKQSPNSRLVIACENTGDYGDQLAKTTLELGIDLYVINPLHLSKSLGLTRGKNDKVDAIRITSFLKKNIDELELYTPPTQTVTTLKLLYTERSWLVHKRAQLKVRIQRLSTKNKKVVRFILNGHKRSLRETTKQIKAIETQIDEVIQEDQKLKKDSGHMRSIPGVGPVLTWQVICKTHAFSRILTPRKMACFSGVAPYDFQSGTSIRRKRRVSVFADKELKKNLHMAAMRAVRLDCDLQKYYLRKVAEGKSKMLVLNSVRNKLIHRIYAVIKNQTDYIPQRN